MFRLIIAICVVAGLGGCSGQTDHRCTPGYGASVAIFTLFFGKTIPGRGDLTDQEWLTFLDTTVTANIPNGYTVFDANGGWMNPVTHKTIKEGTKVVVVVLPGVPDSLAAINRIRTAYQIKFQQQLVGMTSQQACGAF